MFDGSGAFRSTDQERSLSVRSQAERPHSDAQTPYIRRPCPPPHPPHTPFPIASECIRTNPCLFGLSRPSLTLIHSHLLLPDFLYCSFFLPCCLPLSFILFTLSRSLSCSFSLFFPPAVSEILITLVLHISTSCHIAPDSYKVPLQP